MQWKSTQHYHPMFIRMVRLSPLLLIAGLYKEMYSLFFTGTLILLFYGYMRAYFRSIERNLQYLNGKETIRLFPGDKEDLALYFQYNGLFPQISGEFAVSMKEIISSGQLVPSRKGNTHVQMFQTKVTMESRQMARVFFTIKGEHRGVTRISNLTGSIPDVFGFAHLGLSFDLLLRKEILVFPAPLPVQGLENLHYPQMGNAADSFALYENPSYPAGAREYVIGDSFNRIHWKSSMKHGVLQTKVFERTRLNQWIFIFSLPSILAYFSVDKLEQQISYLTYICRFASQKGIPYHIFINIRTPGTFPFVRLSTDGDQKELGKVLELLARIDVSSITVSAPLFYATIDSCLKDPAPVMVMCGYTENDDAALSYYEKWKKHGSSVYRVHSAGEFATLSPIVERAVI